MRTSPLLLAALIGFGLAGCDRHPAGTAARETIRAERGARAGGGGHGLKRECREDIEQYCVASQKGRERRQCLESHIDKLSAGCKQALSERRGGHGEGGGRRNKEGGASGSTDDSDN